jgi:DUF1365 family protein
MGKCCWCRAFFADTPLVCGLSPSFFCRVDSVCSDTGDNSSTAPLGPIVALVSEVSNTPWGEKCWYVHPATQQLSANHPPALPLPSANKSKADQAEPEEEQGVTLYFDRVVKKMHVSPFFEMNYDYQLQYSEPNSRHFTVRWVMEKQPTPPTAPVHLKAPPPPITPEARSVHAPPKPLDRIHFKASMTLAASALSQSVLSWVLLRYPLMTTRVVFGIYWQALWLYANKHITFFTHPDKDKSLF